MLGIGLAGEFPSHPSGVVALPGGASGALFHFINYRNTCFITCDCFLRVFAKSELKSDAGPSEEGDEVMTESTSNG